MVLVSIDGFRHDYFDRFKPPTLTKLAQSGVRSRGLVPQFPSKTFPNHYTIVTGMRLGRHGIVSNNMVARGFEEKFSMSNRAAVRDARWWGGEPIWNTVEKQGGIAAAMFWPGSEAPINGRQPTFWVPFDDSLPRKDRAARIVEWLGLPEGRRPRFLTLYFSDVDHAGHDVGPEPADETTLRASVLGVDEALGELVRGVELLGLEKRVNYVIVSDHGMSQLSADRTIRLDDYIDTSRYTVVDSGAAVAIAPKDGDAEFLYRALAGRHPHMKVYRNAEIPKEYGLAGHPRVPAIFAVIDDGWYAVSKNELDRWQRTGDSPGGAHGYDPRSKSMHGLFVANGPGVRGGGRLVDPFENIHIYDFMCALLGIDPAPNDGDDAVTRDLLRR